MKKLLILFVALALTLTLAGCTKEVEVIVEVPVDVIVEVPIELPDIPADLDMEDLDDYLGRPDVQYVDLRNFDDKLNAGYIAGFEIIPFFDYLEETNILVRTDGDWTFAAEDIVSQGALEALFDEDKTIFLMCGSGTRAGYVLAALEELGYTDVINVGGIASYTGDNLVAGDGEYMIDVTILGDYTPGTYFGFDPVGKYNATVIIGPGGGIVSVVFDAIYGDSTKQDMGAGYTLGSGITWAAEADELAAYIVANQGWGDIILDETDISGANADTVPRHFIEINHDGAIDAVAGVSIGAEGFVLSWNDAISQASTSDLGVVDIDATPEEWAAAHEPVFAYTDGIYYGNDPVGHYMVKVTVEDGFIIDVFFDAVYRDTTKQIMGDAYMLGSGISWATEADELAAYIVSNQGWGEIILDETDLTGLNALTVPHHFLEINHDGLVDAVAGVSIGVEGFVLAWNDAIVQASDSDHGIVVIDASAEIWAAAHNPFIDYSDGVYSGHEEGYTALITVEDGQIVDIFLDAAHFTYGTLEFLSMKRDYVSPGEYPMNYFMNDNSVWELQLLNDELAVDVSGVEVGNASYSTQVYQEGFAVTNGTQYRITFDAYAENARDINVAFGDALDAAPWFTNYVPLQTISLTTTVQTFTIDFTMAETTTVDQGKLVFELGAVGGVAVNGMVVIDNVKIEETDGTDVIALTDQVINGDFADNAMTGWNIWTGDQWSGTNTSTLPRLLDWWTQANTLQDEIIGEQQWVDGISGVTIDTGHWEAAVLEALAEALVPVDVAGAIAAANDQFIVVEGVITSVIFDGTFTMEDADGTAIYVDDYNSDLTWGDLVVAVGDMVQITGLRSDYNNLNLIDGVLGVEVLSSGNAITDAIAITDMATFRSTATADDYAKRYIFTNVEILETGYYAYFFEPVDGEDRMGIVTSYSDDTIVLTAGDFVTFTATWYLTNGDYTDNTKIFRFSVTQASDFVIVTPAP